MAQWIKVFASEAGGLEFRSPRVHAKGEQAWQPPAAPSLGKQRQGS